MLILKNGTRLVSPGTMAEQPPEALWPGNQQPLINCREPAVKARREEIHSPLPTRREIQRMGRDEVRG